MLRSTVNIACVVYVFRTFYHGYPEKLRNLLLLQPPSNASSSARQARAVTEVGESSNEEPQIDYEGQYTVKKVSDIPVPQPGCH